MSEDNKDDGQQRRRIVVTNHAKDSQLVLEPTAAILIEDALSVVATEIIRFKKKASSGRPLELSEARVLQGYIKALVDLSKESREREDEMDLASMSDAEILKYFEQLKQKNKKE